MNNPSSNRKSQVDILARYGNRYDDDDTFAHCFVLRDGRCVILLQGLQPVTLEFFEAPPDKYRRLVKLLEEPVPADWPAANYTGFNFVSDPNGPDATEIAVFGARTGDNPSLGEYYAAPADSEVGRLVKEIAKLH